MPKPLTRHSKRTDKSSPQPFLVEDVMILSAPVVSLLYVLPGWTANVVARGRGTVVVLKREGSAGGGHVWAHEVRDAFASIETIEDAARFFGRYGPMDNQGEREYLLAQIRADQESLKHYRQMDHRDFFGPKKDLRHWYESSLEAELKVGQRSFWSVEAIDVRTAIKNTTCIDHVRQVRFNTCLQCGKLYELPLRRKQLYCDKACQNKATKSRWNQKHGDKQNG